MVTAKRIKRCTPLREKNCLATMHGIYFTRKKESNVVTLNIIRSSEPGLINILKDDVKRSTVSPARSREQKNKHGNWKGNVKCIISNYNTKDNNQTHLLYSWV